MSLIFELAGYGFSAAVVSLVAAVRFGFNQDHHLHCETFSWLRITHSPFPYPVLHLQFNSLFVEKRCKETRTMIKYKKKFVASVQGQQGPLFSSRLARATLAFFGMIYGILDAYAYFMLNWSYLVWGITQFSRCLCLLGGGFVGIWGFTPQRWFHWPIPWGGSSSSGKEKRKKFNMDRKWKVSWAMWMTQFGFLEYSCKEIWVSWWLEAGCVVQKIRFFIR